MIFYVLITLSAILAAFFGISAIKDRSEECFGLLAAGLFIAFIPLIPVLVVWGNHAGDLARISSQSHVIAVHQERVDRLTDRLNAFQYPTGALLNADTPVAAIVASLSDAEKQLAYAKQVQAEAIRSVEARRVGPMSGVIRMVGDYK